MNRKGVIILLSTAAVVGSTVWIIINRHNKKKMLEKLMDDLATGNKSEDPQDIGVLTKTGGALDPTLWRKAPANTPLFKTATAQSEVVKIHDMVHGTFGSDEEGLIKYFSTLKNQYQVSELAEYYQKQYGIALGDDLKTIDNTLFGINFGVFDMPKVMAAILTLPK